MDTKLFSFDDNEYVLGLTWHTISEKADVAGFLEAKHTEYGLTLEDVEGNPRMVGLAITSDPKVTKNLDGEFSAAATLATVVGESILLIEQLDDSTYWLCAVEAGVVLVGTDVVVDEESARRHIDDLLSLSLFTIKGRHSENFGGDGQTFIALVGGAEEDKAEIVKLSPFPFKEYFLVIVGATVLITFVFFLYVNFVHPWIFPPDISISESERDALERRKAKARVEVSRSLKQNLAQPSVVDYWHSLHGIIKNIHALGITGWELDAMTCHQNQCFFKWNNKLASSQASLVNSTVDQCDVAIFPQGEGAQCTMSFRLDPRDVEDVDAEDYVDSYQLRETFLGLARVGLKPFISPAVLDKSVVDSHLLDKNSLFLKGRWELSGPLIVLEDAAKTLSSGLLRTLWPENVEIKCGGTSICEFSMGGSYVGQ